MNETNQEHDRSSWDPPANPPTDGKDSKAASSPDPTPAGPPQIPFPDLPREESAAFSDQEYAGVLRQPQRAIEYVLGSKERLARSLWEGPAVWRLGALLLAVSLLAAIPYGLVSPDSAWWKIAALYCGSLGVCFPSLHTFAQFLDVRLDLARSLAMSLIITATAALFTFAFFPVIWFLRHSIVPDDRTAIGPHELSIFLIAVSLALGLVQLGRCLADRAIQRQRRG